MNNDKKLHLEHIEDLILEEGWEGGKKSLYFLEQIHRQLLGHINIDFKMQYKVDGSPNLVFGRNLLGKFFVGTKSVFNKINPKINFTLGDIEKNHGHNQNLCNILKTAWWYLPSTFNNYGYFSGDVMFTKETILNQDNNTIEFQPNVIRYKMNKGDKKFDDIQLGLYVHTQYVNALELKDCQAIYKIRNKINPTANVWIGFPEINFKHIYTPEIMDYESSKKLYDLIEVCKRYFSSIPIKYFCEHKDIIKKGINTLVRDGIDTLETSSLLKITESIPYENYFHIVMEFRNLVIKAKLFILDYLKNNKPIENVTLTINGEPSAPEGIVVMNTNTLDACKLVNRIIFSKANFEKHAA